ncbi:MAG: hypothetical protein KAW52_01795, partial [candidate division Zixibacteria bacterium]|nr:hypothetical protein [candidate division Zixibacteria bacterium]
DVSQGSSAVIDLPNKKTFLMNAGERGKNFDAGEYIVIPFLNHKGITKIDKLILTDTDSLNLNSARSVLEDVEVKEILLPKSSPFRNESDENVTKKIPNKFQFLKSLEAITNGKEELEIRFFEYPKRGKSKPISKKMLTKIRYKDVSFCLFDGMKKVLFDPEFDWDKFENCSVLVMSELGNTDEIIQVISAIRPQKIIFTRHYFRYEKDKIPALMQVNFPQTEYYRTAESGAIICKTDGEKLWFDLTIR